ncbi:MAG: HupE/UreJ family protein [Desulforhopalus sp.]
MNKNLSTTAPLVITAVTIATVLFPEGAAAHLVTTGMGAVYDNIGHLFLTPEDLIPAIAVGLYAGLRGKAIGRQTLFIFPLAWLIGSIAGFVATSLPVLPLQMLSFLLVGGLIAADLHLNDKAIAILVILVGAMHGLYNGVTLDVRQGASGFFLIPCVLFVLIAITSALTISLRPAWARVVIRVMGSWIAAVGLLMFGWMAKGVLTIVTG